MNSEQKSHITRILKAEAASLGFSACGVAPAKSVKNEIFNFYKKWIAKGDHASMHYLEENINKRLLPDLMAKETKSIISVALNYFPDKKIPEGQLQFSWYAYGKDYHDVVKDKLKILLQKLQETFPEVKIEGRPLCDTAPILERYWAWRSGLGWIGKNTLLILPNKGSTFFIGELLLNIELEYDKPQKNRCGNCTACIQACPTKALEAPYLLNANKCLSYLTIENKENIPEWAQEKMEDCIYGCDRCQKACPWNRFCAPTQIKDFQPSNDLLTMTKEAWTNLTLEQYRKLFKGSSVKRAKYEGLMRNIHAVINSNPQPKDCEQQLKNAEDILPTDL